MQKTTKNAEKKWKNRVVLCIWSNGEFHALSLRKVILNAESVKIILYAEIVKVILNAESVKNLSCIP